MDGRTDGRTITGASGAWDNVIDLAAARRDRDPTAAEEAARDQLRRAYHQPGGFLVRCLVCGTPDALAVKPTKRGWPFAQCSACQTQMHLRGLPAQAALVEHCVRVLTEAAEAAHG